MMAAAALSWAATTLVIKVSALSRVAPEKTLLYQIGVCVPIVALGSLVFGERITAMPGSVAIG
jgi:drug/metabolite transporter (DMT)-like permease